MRVIDEVIEFLEDHPDTNLVFGRHYDASGWFAIMYVEDRGGVDAARWQDAGHGHTLDEALLEARAMFYGDLATRYKPEDFR